MERIRQQVFEHFRAVFVLSLGTVVCLTLLVIRLKISQSSFLLFLVWNLFLAFIPFGITFFLSGKKQHSKLKLGLWFGTWLLFLPNAPYIVTDLIHLHHAKANIWLLDLLVISAYAGCGLLFYLLSVRDMERLLRSFLSRTKRNLILWTVPFLSGFGIYLGRFLRWNSWDVVQRPHKLIRDVWEIVAYPSEHSEAWMVTFFFGIGLGISYQLFMRIPFFRTDESPSATANSE